jgi:O-antigen/teichoic acid export membrane protein
MGEVEALAHSKEVAKGTFWGLAGTFILKIVSFLYIVYVARVVSQGDVGLFYLTLGIVGLFGMWKDLGLPTSLVRYVPFYESRGERGKAIDLLKVTVVANIATGLVLTALVWLAADAAGAIYGNANLPEALRLMSFFMLLDNLLKIGNSYLNSQADIRGTQLLANLQIMSKLALTYAFFQLWGANYFSLILAFLGSYALSILVSIPLVWGKVSGRPTGVGGLSSREILREIIPFGLMLTVLQAFSSIISSADRVILGYLTPHATSSETVAVYSIATTLALNLTVFATAVGSIFLPLISRMVGKNDLQGIRQGMVTAQRWVLFITVPMAAVMIAFSFEMLSSFYGASYSGGERTMQIFLVALVASIFTYVTSVTLAAMRLVKLELWIAFLTGVINVALNLVFIPQWGMEGAAAASGISFAASAVMFGYYGKKIVQFSPSAESYKMLAAGAVIVALLFVLKPAVAAGAALIPAFGSKEMAPYVAKVAYLFYLGLVSAFACCLFAALAILLHCFEREDILVMKSAARRMNVPGLLVEFAERILSYGVVGKDRR